MATVLVTGGTGTLGRQIVAGLVARHFRTRLLTHSRRLPLPHGVEAVQGDLATGTGLREAVTDVAAIVHAASSFQDPQAIDVAGTGRLLDAALGEAARPHVVYISIVGVDRSEFPYYAAKRAAESLVQQSGLPWSVLRATQFHSFAEDLIRSLGADTHSEVAVPPGVRLQPIDSAEVADRLVALVELGPLSHVAQMGGPEVLSIEAMAEAYLRRRGRAATVRVADAPRDPVMTAMFDTFCSGIILAPDHAVGMTTWEAYLERTYAS
jgi:uncharacterized protein YbjT (DUF2867 family)